MKVLYGRNKHRFHSIAGLYVLCSSLDAEVRIANVSGSVVESGTRQYLAQFSNNKNFVQILAFSMSEAA
jgi:hypothetical protein